MKRLLVILIFLVGAALGSLVFYVRDELSSPGPAAGFVLEIPRGLGARGVVDLLAEKNVISHRGAALQQFRAFLATRLPQT